MNNMSEKDPLLFSNSPPSDANVVTKVITKVKVSIEKGENVIKNAYIKAIHRIGAREFMAEFLATFILVTVGNGAIAQFILSHQNNGTFMTVNTGYAIGLMIGAYVAGGVTGAHMNPAVTLAMAMRGKTPWIKVGVYWIAQFLGAFFSSAVVYGVYVDAIKSFDGIDAVTGLHIKKCLDNNITNPYLPFCTGGIFATYPQDYLSPANGVLDQVFGTFLLVLGIFAICDSKNSEVKAGLKPLMIGFLLWGIGGSFGFNCGYAINPARDFAPRLFTAMAGWGKDVFYCSQCSIHHWWLIPLFAPMVGAAIAAPLYWFVIEANHPPSQDSHSDGSVEGQRTINP